MSLFDHTVIFWLSYIFVPRFYHIFFSWAIILSFKSLIYSVYTCWVSEGLLCRLWETLWIQCKPSLIYSVHTCWVSEGLLCNTDCEGPCRYNKKPSYSPFEEETWWLTNGKKKKMSTGSSRCCHRPVESLGPDLVWVSRQGEAASSLQRLMRARINKCKPWSQEKGKETRKQSRVEG